MDNEQGFQRILYLFLLYFISGIFFDFASTLYSWFIPTSLAYPTLGDLSLLLWLLSTSYIFLCILKTLDCDIFSPVLFFLFFALIFGEGIHLVSNSVQIKLWIIGYNDTLGLGHPVHSSLSDISWTLRQVFQYLYFCDEVIGHFLIFGSIFLFFLVFYNAGFKPQLNVLKNKYGILFFSVILLNGLYMSWNVIEGQSVTLFLFLCVLLASMKFYYCYYRHYYVGPINRTIEGILFFTLLFIAIWFVAAGQFKSMPQFFETVKPLVSG